MTPEIATMVRALTDEFKERLNGNGRSSLELEPRKILEIPAPVCHIEAPVIDMRPVAEALSIALSGMAQEPPSVHMDVAPLERAMGAMASIKLPAPIAHLHVNIDKFVAAIDLQRLSIEQQTAMMAEFQETLVQMIRAITDRPRRKIQVLHGDGTPASVIEEMKS